MRTPTDQLSGALAGLCRELADRLDRLQYTNGDSFNLCALELDLGALERYAAQTLAAIYVWNPRDIDTNEEIKPFRGWPSERHP